MASGTQDLEARELQGMEEKLEVGISWAHWFFS